MKPNLPAVAMTIVSLIFSNHLPADVNVLVIGSSRDSGERHNSGVWWNSTKPAFTPASKAFSPTAVGTQLQSILAQDGRGTVNVTVLDRYRTDANMDTGWQAYSYNLATWFHYPYPAGAETARWENLRNEGGTVWDYIVVIGDPYTMEYTPGMYAHGVAKIAEEMAKAPVIPGREATKLVLMMPWRDTGTQATIDHYKEVVYRTARSGGHTVAPAGLAWKACGSPAGTSHPTSAGAYIAAASIYSSMYEQNATASGYAPNDGNATTTFTTYTNNNSASHYTGAFSFQNPYLILDDKKRAIRMSERGTSTEEGFKGKIRSAMVRSKVTYSEYNDGTYVNNIPTGTVWTTNPMPIDFNYGRDGFYSEDFKSYIANPSYWKLAFGYYYQSGTAAYPVEAANDIFIGLMQQQDHDLANRMLNEAPTARNLPTRSLWAQIHQAYPTLNPMRDSTHLSYNWDEAVGSYIYTLFSGRCPLDPKPATDDIVWTCRKIGYETAWRLGRCQSRAPGFKVSPSSATKTTVTPGTTETMSVVFILPPKNDVTVNIGVSSATAASLSTQTMVFTPANYDVPQTVTVTGLAGDTGPEVFNVTFNTVSADEACHGVNDSWEYTVNRTAITYTATFNANGGTTPAPTNKVVTPGSAYGTLATTGRTGYSFNGWFTAASGGSLVTASTTVTASANHTLHAQWTSAATYTVNYVGNGNTGGAVPPNQTKTQGVPLTLATNTGNLSKNGFAFSGWNTAANGSGTAYSPGGTYSADSAITLHAQWNAPPTVNPGTGQTVYLTQSTPWSPALLAPQLWLDADDENTITLEGSTVSTWANKSDYPNRDATAAGTSQPTATVEGLNGKRVITFDGNSDVLNVDLDFLAGVSHSAFVVVKPTAYSNIYGAANGNQSSASLHVGFSSANNYRMNYWANDYGPALSNFVANSANVMNFAWTAGTGKQIFANGKSEGSNTNAGTIAAMSGGGRIGRTTGHGYFGGDIAEFIAITTATGTTIDPADRQKMEGYLAHKWNLHDKLATDHPYKSAPPGGPGAVANLSGSATDTDGGSLTTAWSMFSGPAGVTFGDASAVNTTATFSAPGTYTLRLTANDGYSASTNDVVIIVASQTPYLTWAGGTFANPFIVTDPTGDPDGDGMKSILEFAFGMDPTSAATDALAYVAGGAVTKTGAPIIRNFAATGQPLDFRAVFARRKNHVASELTYTVHFTADLSQWTASPATPTLQTDANAAGLIEVVSVPFPASVPLQAGGTTAPRFFRVSVTSPP